MTNIIYTPLRELTQDQLPPCMSQTAKPELLPYSYEWACKAREAQEIKMYWNEHQTRMITEQRDFLAASDAVKSTIRRVNLFFTQADTCVAEVYTQHLLPHFRNPEIKAMLLSFANREATHQFAYAVPLPIFFDDVEKGVKEYRNIKTLMDKVHMIEDGFKSETLRDLAITLASSSAIVEGVQLYSAFLILRYLSNQGAFNNFGQIIHWSIKDEMLHSYAQAWLFRTLLKEVPELRCDDVIQSILSNARKGVDLEYQAIEDNLSGVEEEIGLSIVETKSAIAKLANRRVKDLGITQKNEFSVETSNPHEWFFDLLKTMSRVAFFEAKGYEYTHGSLPGSFDAKENAHILDSLSKYLGGKRACLA